jgi:hypothetical protein
MRQMKSGVKLFWLFLVALASAACGGGDRAAGGDAPADTASGPLKVAEVLMGTAIGPDRRVVSPSTQFKGTDTIHVSVATTGRGQDATLILVVTAVGDSVPVAQENRFISTSVPLVTDYHFSRAPALRAGKYKVEIFLNGGLADLKEFEVVR